MACTQDDGPLSDALVSRLDAEAAAIGVCDRLLMRTRRLILAGCAGLLLLATSSATAPASTGDGVGFRLEGSRVTPGHPLFDGERKIKLHYRFAARGPIDLEISVVRKRGGKTVRVYTERRARPGRRLTRVWNGLNRRGKAVPDGRYGLRVGPADRRGPGPFAASLKLRGHVFPVDGPHGTRGAIGEFHAPRNGGRIHAGFDVTGACGTPLLAARGGLVKKAGYDPALYGNYALIDARKQDYFYAHMIAPSAVGEGRRIRTGERVGRIGQTGNAASTPCHLHFEVRVQGKPIDPEPELRDWDRRG